MKYKFEAQMRYQTEEAKIQLSSAKSASIQIDNVLEDENGESIDIMVTITREEFENAIRPFVQRTIDLIGTLLKEVGYDMTMIDHILLVGGTSCVPLVKQEMIKHFGIDKIKVAEKPMLAIAEGAGILAHRLDDQYEVVEDDVSAIAEISYSTNHNYYIEIEDGGKTIMEMIIEKQTPIPTEKSKIFSTTTNNQKVAKVSIFSDAEDGRYELQAMGYYLLRDNLPMQSELVFDFHIDINETLSVKTYPKGKKDQVKRIILGRGNADHKALKEIDDLITRSITEYRTLAGEDQLIEFITKKISEIDQMGESEIEDNKWHELYYTITEKYDEIKSNEQDHEIGKFEVNRAKHLILEFRDVLEPLDKNTMIELISRIESANDSLEIQQLSEKLRSLNSKYSLFSAALQIESFADRIHNLPATRIGTNNKQADIQQLNRLCSEAKAKINMNQFEEAIEKVDAAYQIIDNYRSFL